MASIKPEVYAICAELAAEFPPWKFGGGKFKNKSHKFVDLELDLQPSSRYPIPGNPHVQIAPIICVYHKETKRVCDRIYNEPCALCTSYITFNEMRDALQYCPTGYHDCWIYHHQQDFKAPDGRVILPWSKGRVTLDEAKPLLRSVLQEAISLIARKYDLSSNEAFVRALPANMDDSVLKRPLLGGAFGTLVCIARATVGDFAFAEDFLPGAIAEADKGGSVTSFEEYTTLLAALPELKRNYEATGKLI